MPSRISSFVTRRRDEIQERYESLMIAEVVDRAVNGLRRGRPKMSNGPFWDEPRDYLRIQVYQFARTCLARGEAWIDALLAITPGSPKIEDFSKDLFKVAIQAVEPSPAMQKARQAKILADHEFKPDVKLRSIRLSPSTRSRMASDLMVAHNNHVPVRYLIGFLRQLGDEPTKAQSAQTDRASFRQMRADGFLTYFSDLRRAYGFKIEEEGATEVVTAAPISARRLRKSSSPVAHVPVSKKRKGVNRRRIKPLGSRRSPRKMKKPENKPTRP